MAKSTKSEKSDRQRLIEETLKKQRSADRRRGNVIVTVAVVLAIAIVAYPTVTIVKGKIDKSHYAGLDLAKVGAPASVCQPVKTQQGTGVSQHVPEGTVVDYPDAPPAFGAHWNVAGVAPAPFADKFYDAKDRPELEALVHNLEHGYTIMWYDQSVADNTAEVAQIKAIAEKFSADDTNYRLKFIAAPWTSADENGKPFPDGQHVAFTHWKSTQKTTDSASATSTPSTGVWQYCSAPSGAALQTFMKDYPYTDAPEASVI